MSKPSTSERKRYAVGRFRVSPDRTRRGIVVDAVVFDDLEEAFRLAAQLHGADGVVAPVDGSSNAWPVYANRPYLVSKVLA